MPNDANLQEVPEITTEPITLVTAGGALGSIFGTLDPATISVCGADGVCD